MKSPNSLLYRVDDFSARGLGFGDFVSVFFGHDETNLMKIALEQRIAASDLKTPAGQLEKAALFPKI
jgi:hypothetical protein